METILKYILNLFCRILSSIILILTIPMIFIWIVSNIITFIILCITWLLSGIFHNKIMSYIANSFDEIWIDKTLEFAFNLEIK